jgi:hypothetical protein
MAALGLTGAFVDADGDAVEGVMNGPVSSEQPLAHPVAAGPTNVGEAGPIVVVLAACARSFLALALANGALPRRATKRTATTAGITDRSVTRRLQNGTSVLICALPNIGPPHRAGLS